MLHICTNCTHCYKPESPYDYFKKTLNVPDMLHWGDHNFDLKYLLCDSKDLNKIDHTGDKLFMSPCQQHNFYGECAYFCTPDAINIYPSEVSIESDDIDCYIGDEVKLSVTVKPYEIEEENTTDNNEPSTDVIDNPTDNDSDTVPDDTNIDEPSTTSEIDDEEVAEPDTSDEITDDNTEDTPTEDTPTEDETTTEDTPTEPKIVIPEVSYSYQWYKNGRKLFAEKKNEIIVNTKKEAGDEYYCAVTQTIENNGDGGLKKVVTNTNSIKVTVSEKPLDDTTDDTTDTPTDDTNNNTTDTPTDVTPTDTEEGSGD